jgi:hypothetical protein
MGLVTRDGRGPHAIGERPLAAREFLARASGVTEFVTM